MRIITNLILLAATVLLACCTSKPSDPYQAAIDESNRLLDSLMHAQKILGIDAAILIDESIVWSHAFGYADLEHQVPVKAGETKFRIGSVSKPLTATALGKLMDAGRIDIDDPIQTYVPYFPNKKYPITVKQVGGHIAGIRSYRGDEFLSSKPYPTVQSGLTIFQGDTLLFEPGTDYIYSSYGFNLLSAVIEGASGEKFLPFMQREVFAPLEMQNTTADKNDSIIVNRTSFYYTDSLGEVHNAPYVDNSNKWAGGGFISTTTDLIKFGQAHMKPGFLSAETLRTLTTTQVLENGDSTGYGIGWRRIDRNGLKGFGHTGGSVGGITAFRIYPEEKLILVLLSNSSSTDYGNVGDRIVDLFLKARR